MDVPDPERGGTFFYCPWRVEMKGGHEVHWCSHRTRTLKAYRRHWRKAHA